MFDELWPEVIAFGVAAPGLLLLGRALAPKPPPPPPPAKPLGHPFLVNNGVVYACPVCGDLYPFRDWVGEDGICEHILTAHPEDALAGDVRVLRARRKGLTLP